MGLIEVNHLSKAFGETRALDDVSLQLRGGEVHALLGENGAGKSTLVKIATGVVTPDAGELVIDGETVLFGSARQAGVGGVSTAFQELSLLPNLSVAENLLLPDLPRGRAGLVSRRKTRSQAARILADWDLQLSPDAAVEGLPLAAKQRLEIVKALRHEPKLLILDEPTAALADTAWLFGHIRRATAAGCAVLYISHKLPEIKEICDRGTVLRNGRVVGTFERENFDEDRLITQMIGRSFEATFPARSGDRHDEIALRIKDLESGDTLHGATLNVHKGEVVGLAALEGQGQRDLFYTIYGVQKPTAGTIEVEGSAAKIRSPRAALHVGSGIALVPEERKAEALFLELDGRKNLTVPILDKVATGGFISRRRERRRAAEEAEALNVDVAALDRPVGRLSGGNQQKVVLGKTLLTGAKTLLLFDPTRGIDAATKLEIYDLVRRLADQGTAILVYSTEIPELVGLCDRVYAMYGGRITGEFTAEQLTEDNVMTATIGHHRNGHPETKGQAA